MEAKRQYPGPVVVHEEKNVEHRFHSIEEDLAVLVFFAPAENSNKLRIRGDES